MRHILLPWSPFAWLAVNDAHTGTCNSTKRTHTGKNACSPGYTGRVRGWEWVHRTPAAADLPLRLLGETQSPRRQAASSFFLLPRSSLAAHPLPSFVLSAPSVSTTEFQRPAVSSSFDKNRKRECLPRRQDLVKELRASLIFQVTESVIFQISGTLSADSGSLRSIDLNRSFVHPLARSLMIMTKLASARRKNKMYRLVRFSSQALPVSPTSRNKTKISRSKRTTNVSIKSYNKNIKRLIVINFKNWFWPQTRQCRKWINYIRKNQYLHTYIEALWTFHRRKILMQFEL